MTLSPLHQRHYGRDRRPRGDYEQITAYVWEKQNNPDYEPVGPFPVFAFYAALWDWLVSVFRRARGAPSARERGHGENRHDRQVPDEE